MRFNKEPIIQIIKELFSKNSLQIGKPPNPLYLDQSTQILCKILKIPTDICCLEINGVCEHKSFSKASDYKWHNKCIIVATESASGGLINFLIPLRAKVRSTAFLRPIVLLLEIRFVKNFYLC